MYKNSEKYISDNELNTEVKYHKIYHILSKKVKKFKEQDAQAFINKLNQDDFQYLYDCVETNGNENRLQYIIFASKNMKKLYNAYSDVIFADITYNTNKYKLPLMIFSIVDSQGKSNIITMALLPDETKETFQTVLEDFLTIHKVAPRVIVTDQDKALSYTIDTKFLEPHHILCHWHLKQNIAKNLGWLNNPK